MHEYSIVQALLNQCENIVEENQASTVISVTIKIGVLSGVELHLLESAFDTFKEKTVCENSRLIIHHQKVKLHCDACGHEFEIDDYEYQCTDCGSENTRVIDGEDMYLMSLEME